MRARQTSAMIPRGNDLSESLATVTETRTTPAAVAAASAITVQKHHILSGTRQLKQSNSVLAGSQAVDAMSH